MLFDPFREYLNKQKRKGRELGVRKAFIFFIHSLDIADCTRRKFASPGELSCIEARRALYKKLHVWLVKKEDLDTIYIQEGFYKDLEEASERKKKELYKEIERLKGIQDNNGAMQNKLTNDKLHKFLQRAKTISTCAAVLQGSTSCIDRGAFEFCDSCKLKEAAAELEVELEDVK